jgi:predicted esterase YcpF (UPF0227 family)
MILYIHGFGSSGLGAKAIKFRKHYNNLIAPSLSHIPNLAIDTLEQMIEFALRKDENIYLIGSSLGGYMALYLGTKYNLKTVLINPSTKPMTTLEKLLGMTHHYHDLSHFEWTIQHLKMLEKYRIKTTEVSNFLLLLQKGDETIDYKEAYDLFRAWGIDPSQMVIEEGGSHAYDDIESKFDLIDDFFNEKE